MWLPEKSGALPEEGSRSLTEACSVIVDRDVPGNRIVGNRNVSGNRIEYVIGAIIAHAQVHGRRRNRGRDAFPGQRAVAGKAN